ncbi:MAG: hypothetical protein HY774_10710 [Acidobacteria bacterium]|nr:hypothetical protein [Acidobacteriota bacterium]
MNEHRPAVLNCIGLDLKEVGAIQGIVIAGRNSGYNAEHLRRLKANDRGPIKVMTYDDLLIGLGNLIATFEKL